MADTQMSRLSLILLLVLAGCGAAAPESRDRVGDDYSCEFKLNEGPASWIRSEEKPVPSYFGKYFDRAALDSVLNLSGRATIEYLRSSEGIDIIRVAVSTEGKCHYYDVLPQATSVWQNLWDKTAGRDDTGLLLTGMYYNAKINSPSGRDTILVRRDSNRWTLLHEFMHHLYAKRGGRATLEELASDIANRKAKVSEDIRLGALDRASAQASIGNAVRYFWKSEEYINRFVLEEIAVESTLQEEYHANRLRLVPDKSSSSGAYVTQSARAAMELFTALKKTRDDLSSILKTAQDSVLENSMNDVSTVIAQRISEIKELTAKHGDSQKMVALTLSQGHQDCGLRDARIESVIKERETSSNPLYEWLQ